MKSSRKRSGTARRPHTGQGEATPATSGTAGDSGRVARRGSTEIVEDRPSTRRGSTGTRGDSAAQM